MSKVQVLHMQKRVTISGGLNRHITRVQWVDGKLVVWSPDNADPELTKNNVELVSREIADSAGKKRTLSLQQAVNKRIDDAGIKPRKGQSRCLEIIFSGSHEVMCDMSREEVLKWSNDTLVWAQKTWGEDNVVSASLHLDERTPHIHMIVVPIVKGQSRRSKKQKELDKERGVTRDSYKINHDKLRLCCNEVFTTPLLYYYHDHYAEDVSKKYGLERGLRAEPGSKKKHQDSEDYNRQLATEAAEKQSLIAEIQSDYTSAVKKKKDAERKQQEAETRQKEAEVKHALAEQKVTEKETQINELEKKSTSLSGEITTKEERVSELQGKIARNVKVIEKQVSDYNARKEIIEEQQSTIDANSAKISSLSEEITSKENKVSELQGKIESNVTTINKQVSDYNAKKEEILKQQSTIDNNAVKICDQDDQLMYYEQQNEIYQEIGTDIENRQEQLRALSSRGLQKLIENIPNIIKDEVQNIVNKNWRGELVSFEEFDDKVGEEPQKFVRIHMQNGPNKYEFEVQESNGHVWKEGAWYKWSKTQKDAYMPELASYFRQELLPETKEFVKSLYKKVEPKPAEAVEQGDNVVWECDLGINKCRIVQKPNGIYHLEREEWDKSKVDQNGRFAEKVWKKQKGFKSFKELKRDKDYAYLEITHSDGKKEYVNQYGNGLSLKHKKSLGISTSGMTLG